MTESLEHDPGEDRRFWRFVAVVIACAAAGIVFRLAMGIGLQHTSLVFIGVPAVLAVAVSLAPQAGTARGTILRSTTLALLLAGTVLGEAFVCILMASPLIYAVALGLSVCVDWEVKRAQRRHSGFAHPALLVLMVAAVPAMEGVVPRFEFPREASATVVRIVPASPAEVERALATPMRFDRPLPRFLRLGFPTPGAAAGAGLRVGDVRTVELRHGHHPGTLTMRVRGAAPGRVEFVPVSDDSYIVHWLSWRSAKVQWRAVPGGTEVRWTLQYRRRLDPAFYFAPLERYGVGVAAGYLIDALATPR